MSSRKEIKGKKNVGQESPDPGVRRNNQDKVNKHESAPQTEAEIIILPPSFAFLKMMLCLRLGSGPPAGRPPSPDLFIWPLPSLCPSLGISWSLEQLALPWHIYRMNFLLSKLRPPTWKASGLLKPLTHRVGDLLWCKSRFGFNKDFSVTGGLEWLGRNPLPSPMPRKLWLQDRRRKIKLRFIMELGP